MRNILIFSTFFLIVHICSAAYADIWYVVNKEGKVMVKCDYEPGKKDLASREEFTVKQEEDIPLEEAEYKDGKVIRHIKTPEELQQEQEAQLQLEGERKIQEEIERMQREEAIENLKARGEIE